jgi:hypothetical protein
MRSTRPIMRRREFVQFLSVLSGGGTIFGDAVLSIAQEGERVTREMVIQAEEIAGLHFTDAQRELLIPNLQRYLQNIQRVREMAVPSEVAPAMYFIPDTDGVWNLKAKKSREG